MSLASNIVRRPGSSVYYARVEVPIDVKPLLKRNEIWKSLRTRDPQEARAKAPAVLAEWQSQFEELRRRHAPSPEDLQAAVWSHYEDRLAADNLARTSLPTDADIQTATAKLIGEVEAGRVEWSDDPRVQFGASLDLIALNSAAGYDRERRKLLLRDLRRQAATGETALISAYADTVILRDKLLIERGSPEYRDLCARLQRAQIQALERTVERDAGKFDGEATDPLVVPPDATAGRKHAAPGETIMELYDRFSVEKRGTASADTWKGNRKIVQLFAEFIGESSHITAITKKAVRDWKHKLAEWPLKAGDMKVFKGMSFRKIVEANATHKKPTISDKTKNKYLAAIGSFAEWLLQNEYIDADVMRGMYLTVDKKRKTGYSFSSDQLRTIFTSPLFSHCLGDGKEHLPGNVAIRDWRYWLPWLGLYSGARLGEMAQLLTKDVFQDRGIWVMHITELGDETKSTKNAGSMRVVPIHSKLIEMGFIEYHAAAVRENSTQLFPEMVRDTRGYFGEASKFFNNYLRDIGVKVDKNTKFHSFRHTTADAFRDAGYMDDDFDILLGHTEATTTQMYGKIVEGNLKKRSEMIEALNFAL